jgi:hypothetical protein
MLAVVSCAQPRTSDGEQAERLLSSEPTRGYILISIDTLRADHLGCYGYRRPTSPFMDSLASRGVLFERAFVQYPATLVSHMSLFTGLYPPEHAVYPPSSVLSDQIETLPERFQSAGFKTAGHTEGGFVAGDFGFARGFEEFTDTGYSGDEDIERTFARGIDFLSRLAPEDRFFLFLHTYSVHDPYDPPKDYWNSFLPDSAQLTESSHGADLRLFNRGERPIPREAIKNFEALYDASIRYTDDVIENLFKELERLNLLSESTVMITSDHGEEFLEHGKLVHEQLYPENLHVPLILVHPDVDRSIRVPDLVEGVDIAATLYELAGLSVPDRYSGSSLVPLVTDTMMQDRGWVYGELLDLTEERTLIGDVDGTTYQLLQSRPASDGVGKWITKKVVFDTAETELRFEAVSFHRPRRIDVRVDGVERQSLVLGTDRIPIRLELSSRQERHRVELSTEGCDSPATLGLSDDTRCLSFQLRGMPFQRSELYDLDRDPEASTELSKDLPEVLRKMENRLQRLRWEPVDQPALEQMPEATESALRALGYIDN